MFPMPPFCGISDPIDIGGMFEGPNGTIEGDDIIELFGWQGIDDEVVTAGGEERCGEEGTLDLAIGNVDDGICKPLFDVEAEELFRDVPVIPLLIPNIAAQC